MLLAGKDFFCQVLLNNERVVKIDLNHRPCLITTCLNGRFWLCSNGTWECCEPARDGPGSVHHFGTFGFAYHMLEKNVRDWKPTRLVLLAVFLLLRSIVLVSAWLRVLSGPLSGLSYYKGVHKAIQRCIHVCMTIQSDFS